MKLHVMRTPAMSVIAARIDAKSGSMPRRTTFATRLSGDFTRLETCSIGL